MVCPCCVTPCCTNGYSTVTFTLSGGTTGNPQECAGQEIPQCGRLNGSYVFSAEDVFNGTVTGLVRYITVREECTVGEGPTATYNGPIVVRLTFGVTCKGAATIEAYMTSGLLYSYARWPIQLPASWSTYVVDPDDNCLASASFGPSLPSTYTSGIINGVSGSAPGIWGFICGGWPLPDIPSPPTTVQLQVTVTR